MMKFKDERELLIFQLLRKIFMETCTRCISQQSSVASNARGSTLNEGTSDPRESISVTTHQPLTSTCDSSSPFVGGGGSIDKAVTAPHSSVDLTIGSGSGVSARVRTVGTETDSNNNGSLSQLSSSVQDLKKPPLNLKPPRQGGPSEHEGGVNIDRTTLHYICQDVTAMKTLLLRLRRVLQVTDTLNPFDANLKTSPYLNLGTSDSGDKEEMNSVQDVFQQNVDLKRQVVLLQQRLEEKDRNIRSLQQQLSQALNLQKSDTSNKNNNNTNISGSQQFPFLTPSSSYITTSSSSSEDGLEPGNSPKPVAVVTANAATQTDRFPTHTRASPFSLASMSRTSSIEDGLGPTVR